MRRAVEKNWTSLIPGHGSKGVGLRKVPEKVMRALIRLLLVSAPMLAAAQSIVWQEEFTPAPRAVTRAGTEELKALVWGLGNQGQPPRLLGTLGFFPDSLTPDPFAQAEIARIKEAYNGDPLLVIGAGFMAGGREWNLAIGQRIADETKKTLVNHGVPAKGIATFSQGREFFSGFDPALSSQSYPDDRERLAAGLSLRNEANARAMERARMGATLTAPSLKGLPWRERLDRVVQSELRNWLNIDGSGLDEVPPPIYPAALTLKQESWETHKEFEDRVEGARTERRLAIERLQSDYRTKVELRNKRVTEYNRFRQEREAGLVKRRQELILAGLEILAPEVKLSDAVLDQQIGVLSISAEIEGLGRQVFSFKDAPQAFRRSALTEASSMKASPEFQVSQTGEISLMALSVQAGGASVRGIPSSSVVTQATRASAIIPAQSPALAQQSAVTVDQNQVEKILYRDENEMLRRRLEEQRRQQEAALAAAETRAAQEIARIRAEAQRAGEETVRAPQAQVQEAHALVIGNSDYRGGARLDNPLRDAQAMSAKLRSLGFKVTELSNTNREQMVKGLSEFTRTASKADLTLLFYAGHGMQVQGVNYMIPVDMSLSDPSQATLQAVSLTQVVEQYLPGKTKLVFLDACRDNPIVTAGVRGASKGLAPINVSEGTLIAYATKDGQTAEDGTGSKNSPFTRALLEHLADPFDIGVVLRRVREKVMLATGGKQQPWEYGSLTGGELVLSKVRGGRP